MRSEVGQWQRAVVAQTRGLSRKHNHTLEAISKRTATTVILKGKPAGLYADYERLLAAGPESNLAKLPVARKIAAIVMHMWERAGGLSRQDREHRRGCKIRRMICAVVRDMPMITRVRTGEDGSQVSIREIPGLGRKLCEIRRRHG